MNKFFARLILFSTFIPLLFVILFVFNQFHFLAFFLLILGLTIIGGFESRNMFHEKTLLLPAWFLPVSGCLFPIAAYLSLWFNFSFSMTEAVLITIIAGIVLKLIFFPSQKKLEGLLSELTASLFVVIYPGFLFSYILRIITFKEPSLLLAYFILMVFLNDIIAYLAGSIFGKGRSLNLSISPNKTVIGFIMGFLASPGISLVFYVFWPYLFNNSILTAVIIGVAIGFSTIAGDLIESGMKRSALIKDSGTIMMGRGGILDSIDSMMISAPVFYYLYILLAAGQ